MYSNFNFLQNDWQGLAKIGEMAEYMLYKDPNTAIMKLRQFGEELINIMLKVENFTYDKNSLAVDRILILKRAGLIPADIDNILTSLRKKGNKAAHGNYGDEQTADTLLSLAVKLGAWFQEVYGTDYLFQSESVEYKKPENIDYEKEYQKLVERTDEIEKELENIKTIPHLTSREDRKKLISKKKEIEFTEEETRLIIDKQLIDAGWEVDTKVLNYKLNKTLPETQSVGQDNIGYIVSALVDFYLHKQKTENYNGGILCIDEIDASLHPNAQLRLFDLLDRLSEELELQIFVTTHSLTILKKIIKKQSRSSEDYRLVYFVDPELPRLSSIEHYADIKSDMFDKMTPYRPYVKIYCEDDMTEFLFNELIEAYKRLHPDTKSDIYKVIPIHLGCKQLLKLPEYDSHFKDVLIIVDGDTKTNSKKLLYPYINADEKLIKGVKTNELPQNVIALPTFLAPESFIYYVVKTIVDNENYNKFWKDLEDREESRLYTKSRINEVLNQINIKDDTKNDDIKSLERLQELQKFITDTQLFNYLMEENIIDELIDFCLKVYSQINILLQREKSKNY